MIRSVVLICARAGRWLSLGALLVVSFTGCVTSHEKRTVYHYEPAYDVASEDFERALVSLGGGLLPGNQAILLNNGDAFFPAILEAIRAAKLSVNIELYIFAKGRMAESFVQALCDKAREGVEIRVLVDAAGERLGQLDNQLKSAGVKFHVYKPLKTPLHRKSQRPHAPQAHYRGRAHRLHGRIGH